MQPFASSRSSTSSCGETVGCVGAGGGARDVTRSERDGMGAVCVLRVRGTVVPQRKLRSGAVAIPVDDDGVGAKAPDQGRAFA